MRTVPEWIGKTPDTKVPDRVRDRIFQREDCICHLSGRIITDGELWDLDHVQALVNGGEHRESNLKPALRDKHREKTSSDVREKSIIARKRKAASGIRKPRTIRAWRRFDGTPVFAPKER
jgi:5-methylcytosine-specific restriction protein A